MSQHPFLGPTQRLTQHRYLNLFTTEVHTASGQRPWIFASRKETPLTGKHRPDAVAIVAVVNGGDAARLLVIREFRPPLGRYQIALPAGLIDDGEDVVTAAARELREETGLTLTRALHVTPSLAVSAGLTDETVCLVYGEATGTFSRLHLDQHEDIESRLVDYAELKSLIADPGEDVICLKLYLAAMSFLAAGKIALRESR